MINKIGIKKFVKLMCFIGGLVVLLPTLSLADLVDCTPTSDTTLPYQSYVGYQYTLSFTCTNTTNSDISNFMAASSVSPSNGQFVLNPLLTTCPTSPGTLLSGASCEYSGIFTPQAGHSLWNLQIAFLNKTLHIVENYPTQGLMATGPGQLIIKSSSNQNVLASTGQTTTNTITIENVGVAPVNTFVPNFPPQLTYTTTCPTDPVHQLAPYAPGITNTCTVTYSYTAPGTDSGQRVQATPSPVSFTAQTFNNTTLNLGLIIRALHADTGAFIKTPEESNNFNGMLGNVTGLAESAVLGDISLLYATTGSNGVYYSTDQGATWLPDNAGLPANVLTSIRSIAVSANGAAYICTSGNGVYQRGVTDGQWNLLSNTWQGGVTPNVTVASTGSNATVYAGTDTGAVYFYNATATPNWSLTTGLPGSGAVTALVYNSPLHQLYAAVSGGGVYSSTDGASWTALGSGLPSAVNNLTQDAAGDLYAATTSGVYKFTVSGNVWTPVGAALSAVSVSSVGVEANGDIYAATAKGIYKFAAAGTDWVAISNGLPATAATPYLVAQNPGEVYAYAATSSMQSLYKLNLTTNIWQSVNSWLGSLWGISSITTDSNGNVYVGATGSNSPTVLNGVYELTNNGGKTVYVGSGLESANVTSLAVNQNTLYAAAIGSATVPTGVYTLSPTTNQWTLLSGSFPMSKVSSINILFDNQNNLFAAANTLSAAAVYEFSPQNNTWVLYGNTLSGLPLRSFAIDKQNNLYLGTVSLDSGLYELINNVWQRFAPTFPVNNSNILGLAFDSTNSLYALFTSGTQSGVYQFANGAWTDFTANLPASAVQNVSSLVADSAGYNLYVGVDDAVGVYKRAPADAQWTALGGGSPLPSVSQVVVDNQCNVYALLAADSTDTYYGVYESPDVCNKKK